MQVTFVDLSVEQDWNPRVRGSRVYVWLSLLVFVSSHEPKSRGLCTYFPSFGQEML